MLYVIILCIITLKQYFHLLFFTVYLHFYSTLIPQHYSLTLFISA